MFEKFPRFCNVCGREVKVTSSEVAYGKKYGEQMYIYCPYCTAHVAAKWNEEEEKYEACGILTTKHMRVLQKKLLNKIKEETEYGVPLEDQKYLRNVAYKTIAKYLDIPKDRCYIGIMNIEQLEKTENIMDYFWEEFLIEKQKRFAKKKTTATGNSTRKKIIQKEDLPHITLTEEDLLDVKKQAEYIIKGRQNVQKKTYYERTTKGKEKRYK